MDFTLISAPRKLLPAVKAKLREKIPRLNEKQLKRLRMPLSEALEEELEELNCRKALEVFRKILETDKKQEKYFERKENQKLLKNIFESLKEIEHKSNEAEIEILLKIIDDIWNIDKAFDWLVELLLVHSSDLIEKYNLDDRKIDVIVKFTHATALSQRLQWYRFAVVLLESAFILAAVNEEWTFKSEQFCAVISHQLSDCLTKLSREVRETEKDIDGALMLSKRSLKVIRTYISNKSIKLEMEAEFEHANCYFDSELYENALNHFNHALILAECEKYKRKSCEALMKIAECHKG